ncbi:MAG: hypothetical protein AAF409_14800 [Pseudomonadota bacterium]
MAFGIAGLRVALVVTIAIVAMEAVTSVLANKTDEARVSAFIILSMMFAVLPGSLAFLHLLRSWLLRRTGDLPVKARWRGARADLWLSPFIFAFLTYLDTTLLIPAVTAAALGIAVASLSQRSLGDEWPSDLIQVAITVAVAAGACVYGYWFLLDGPSTLLTLLIGSGIVVWLWLIALLGWRRPPDGTDDVEPF